MEGIEEQGSKREAHNTYKLSWLAYVKSVIVFLVMSVIAWAFGVRSTGFFIVEGLALALFVYNVTYLKSVKLYTDDDGVWCFCGIFPWNKGFFGVRWRDVDSATFSLGFVSWIAKSYAVSVGHRYTKDSEIALKHVRFGDDAVKHINAVHTSMLSAENGRALRDEPRPN